jgi:hypothetical protein
MTQRASVSLLLMAGLLAAAVGCTAARQQSPTPAPVVQSPAPVPVVQSPAPQAAAVPTPPSYVQPVAAYQPAMMMVPYHAVPVDPRLRPASPRRYPIAVPPMRTYDCCH